MLGQGADKLLPARSSCRAGTLAVDAGHADLEIAALPLGLTFKGKAGVVYDILESGDTGPAAYVAHHAEDVDIFTDIEITG